MNEDDPKRFTPQQLDEFVSSNSIASSRLEDVAPKVVILARDDVRSKAAHSRPKFLKAICEKLISLGVSERSSGDEVSRKIDGLWVLYPRFFHPVGEDMSKNVDVLLSLEFEGDEILFPVNPTPKAASKRKFERVNKR